MYRHCRAVGQVALFVLEEPVGDDPRIARVDALRTQLERHEYVCAAPKSGYDAALLRFYDGLGAAAYPKKVFYRLTGDALADLAKA
jgi:hypothetical protein